MSQQPLTVEQFLMANPPASLGGAGSLTALLSAIGLVGKTLARDMRIAGLLNMLGMTGETNVQGESVKKLDQIANDTFIEVLQRDGVAGALASEEMEKPVFVASPGRPAPYMVLFDPLDGSSNTDVNMPLGSIFSIVEHQHPDQPLGDDDLLRKGIRSAGGRLFSVRAEHHARLYDRQGSLRVYARSQRRGVSIVSS